MIEENSNRHVFKRIVFGYSLDFFPGSLLLGHHQLKRMIERAGFDLSVLMSPLSDVPPDTDLLFVVSELEQAARQAAPHARVEVVEDFVNHPAYERLIKELEAGTTIIARKIDERERKERAKILHYRGYERLDG